MMNSFMLRFLTRVILTGMLLAFPASGRSQSLEVCDDTIDNDSNGYVDVYDLVCQPGPVACTVPVTPAAFTIKERKKSSRGFGQFQWLVTGDVDGDGETEIVAHQFSSILIMDGDTLAAKTTIRMPSGVSMNNGDSFVIGNLDTDPELEMAFLSDYTHRLHILNRVGETWTWNISPATETAYDCLGNQGTGVGLGLADFNGDGIPEFFYGNEIWTWSGDLDGTCADCIKKLIDTDRDVSPPRSGYPWAHGCKQYIDGATVGHPQGAVSAVADILDRTDCEGDAECDGPELIVGPQVFSVNLDAAPPSVTLRRDLNPEEDCFDDGKTTVADIDGDGDLDVVVHARTQACAGKVGNLYAWDPIESGSVRVWDVGGLGLHGYSPVAVADVWDEDIADDGEPNGSVANVPELVFTRVRKL